MEKESTKQIYEAPELTESEAQTGHKGIVIQNGKKIIK